MGDTLSTLSETPPTSEHSLPRGKPLVRMQKKPKTVRPVSNVAAIEFGTTYCSLAYITEGYQEPTMMNFVYNNPRVPTSLLLKRNDDNGTVDVKCFGYEARREYTRIRPKSQHQYIYFDRIKMSLKEEEDIESVKLNMTIEDDKGDKYYLVEVIALMLNQIKTSLVDQLSRTTTKLKATDFNWVITVPAIWKGRGKQLMREAAYKAGLCSNRSPITLTQVGMAMLQSTETNPEKLMLVFEPEAAAIYCQKKGVSAEYCDQDSSFTSSNYMVVDIGGGTVDLAVHHIDENGKMEVLTLPQGTDCGGTRVNREFETTLRHIVGEELFSKLWHGKAKPQLDKVIYSEFEEEKVKFGENVDCRLFDQSKGGEEMKIDLYGLLKHVEEDEIQEGLHNYNDPNIQFDDGLLFVKYSRAAEFFRPSIDAIVDCVQTNLNNLSEPIDTIYLVGGFGGCRYIYSKIKELVQNRLQQTICVLVPKQQQLAIVIGAVLLGRDPSLIKSRPVDATYGISLSLPFKSGYRKQNLFIDPNGCKMCKNLFTPCVLKGETLAFSDVFSLECTPVDRTAHSLLIDLYRTEYTDIQYTPSTPEEDDGSLKHIGVIRVPILGDDPSQETKLEILLDLSSTEIQAQVINVKRPDHFVKTIIDYF